MGAVSPGLDSPPQHHHHHHQKTSRVCAETRNKNEMRPLSTRERTKPSFSKPTRTGKLSDHNLHFGQARPRILPTLASTTHTTHVRPENTSTHTRTPLLTDLARHFYFRAGPLCGACPRSLFSSSTTSTLLPGYQSRSVYPPASGQAASEKARAPFYYSYTSLAKTHSLLVRSTHDGTSTALAVVTG